MKKLTKDISKFTQGSATLAVGSAMTSKLGYGSSGMAAAGGMMPMVGTTMMGTGMLRMVKKLKRKKRKRRKK